MTAAEASRGISSNSIYDMFARVLAEINAGGDTLDYGCGTGTLTQKLLESGRCTTVIATDILPAPLNVSPAIKWITSDLNYPLSAIPDSSLDLVVSCEVIEHLENPRAAIRDWFRILRPQGTIVFSTPNNESWRALLSLLVQGHFVLFGDKSYPAHITALLRKDMERIAIEAGFEKPEFRYSDYGFIPKFPGRSWQKLSGGLLKGLRFSDNIVAIAKKP